MTASISEPATVGFNFNFPDASCDSSRHAMIYQAFNDAIKMTKAVISQKIDVAKSYPFIDIFGSSVVEKLSASTKI